MLRSKSNGDFTTTARALLRAHALGERLDLPAHREGRARADHARAAAKKVFAQLRRDVDGRAAQGHNRLLSAAALRPVDVTLVAQRRAIR